ncbi:MAG TPA: hypothetical protein PKM73_11025 [Verrucomicrobiota bacterium]|nr:hypothetical protein [Verrucomicrobiota bacterium]HNU52304.1 hypothetical protein [Verrucomicrobiota bacterium]
MKAKRKGNHLLRPLRAWSRLALALAGLLWVAGTAWAAAWVDMPEITVNRNDADPMFVVYMNITEEPVEVMGIAFNLQVEDGGSAAGGAVEGPAIKAVDILTGTVFEGNSNGLSGTGSIVPQVYEEGTITVEGTITLAPGLWKVATVTLDTTGFSSGTYRLTLDTRNGPTRYTTLEGDYLPALHDGSVTIVPEPAFWGWASGGGLLLLAGVRRIRRRIRRPDGSATGSP